MRIEPIGIYTSTYILDIKSKRTTSTKIDSSFNNDYNNKPLQNNLAPSKTINLIAHSNLFETLLNEKESIKNNFTTKDEAIKEMKKLIYSSKSSKDLQDEFEYLHKKGRIKFDYEEEEANGYITFNPDDISKSIIILSSDVNIKMATSTLIHELQHFKDLTTYAKNKNLLIHLNLKQKLLPKNMIF